MYGCYDVYKVCALAVYICHAVEFSTCLVRSYCPSFIHNGTIAAVFWSVAWMIPSLILGLILNLVLPSQLSSDGERCELSKDILNICTSHSTKYIGTGLSEAGAHHS